MICKTRQFACVPTAANTASKGAHRLAADEWAALTLQSKFPADFMMRAIGKARRVTTALLLSLMFLRCEMSRAQSIDPETGRLLERALAEAENFRKELPHIQYDVTMRVQEWDGRGRLRGTAKASAIVRPGEKRSMIFTSREIEGKVRLPDDKEDSKENDEKEVPLQEFAREHRIAERFTFEAGGVERIAGESARHVLFQAKSGQPEKNTADRFLDMIGGEAWVTEDRSKLVKFELHLLRPFQLLWIFAALKDLSIQYELISPGEILGHAKMKIAFTLSTPVYTIRQLHDLDLDHFQRRETLAKTKSGQDSPN